MYVCLFGCLSVCFSRPSLLSVLVCYEKRNPHILLYTNEVLTALHAIEYSPILIKTDPHPTTYRASVSRYTKCRQYVDAENSFIVKEIFSSVSCCLLMRDDEGWMESARSDHQ